MLVFFTLIAWTRTPCNSQSVTFNNHMQKWLTLPVVSMLCLLSICQFFRSRLCIERHAFEKVAVVSGCCIRLKCFEFCHTTFCPFFSLAIQQFWTQRKQEQIRVVAHSSWLFALTEGIYSKCLIFWKELEKINAPSQSQAVNIGQFFFLSHAVITWEASNCFDLFLSKCSLVVQHFGKHVHKNWANHLLFARVFSICSVYWGLPALWNKSLASFLLSAPIRDFKSFGKKLQHQRCVP